MRQTVQTVSLGEPCLSRASSRLKKMYAVKRATSVVQRVLRKSKAASSLVVVGDTELSLPSEAVVS